jgi:hypothetical protein
MKYCSSVVIGGIDAYLIIWVMNLVRHLTFIKQIWYMYIHMAGYSLHTLHVSETLKLEWDKEILNVINKFTQIYQ